MPTTIAHAGHWIGPVLWLSPLVALAILAVVNRHRERRRKAARRNP